MSSPTMSHLMNLKNGVSDKIHNSTNIVNGTVNSNNSILEETIHTTISSKIISDENHSTTSDRYHMYIKTQIAKKLSDHLYGITSEIDTLQTTIIDKLV